MQSGHTLDQAKLIEAGTKIILAYREAFYKGRERKVGAEIVLNEAQKHLQRVAINAMIDEAVSQLSQLGLTYAAADIDNRLADPVAVHVNMLRGTIAKPTVDQILHLYPELCRKEAA